MGTPRPSCPMLGAGPPSPRPRTPSLPAHGRARPPRHDPLGRGAHEDDPAAGDLEEPVVRDLRRREGRHRRRQRVGEVDAAQDPRGRGQGARGEGDADARRDRRVRLAGAAARPGQGRQGEPRGGRRAHPRAARALREAQQRARGEPRRGRDAGGARRAVGGAGGDRAARRLGGRPPPRGGDGGAALPAGRRRRDAALGRGEAARGAVQDGDLAPRPPAPRRAHEPPGRRDDGVARAVLGDLPRRVAARDARPVVPRARDEPDGRARPRADVRVPGVVLGVPRGEVAAARGGAAAGVVAAADPRARARVDPLDAEGADREEQVAHRALPRARGPAGRGGPRERRA